MNDFFSFSFFLLSSFLFVRREENRRRHNKHHKGEDENDSNYEDNDSTLKTTKTTISSRGKKAILPGPRYMRAFMKCFSDPCEPSSYSSSSLRNPNPNGYIGLCVAENKLGECQEMLAQRLMRPGTAITCFSDSIVYEYSGFLGLAEAREAAAYFLTKRFLLASSSYSSSSSRLSQNIHEHSIDSNIKSQQMYQNQEKDQSQQSPFYIDPSNVIIGPGASSLLNHLFFTLADRGDVVMIPAPYYAAFEKDMKLVAECIPFSVKMKDPVKGPTKTDLENAYKHAKSMGLRPRILLLTNPHNPLGIIYHRNVLLAAVEWARSKKNMHTIVDEIYALSVFKKDKISSYESIIKILDNKLESNVHFVWSMGKDFAACGFRLAILYTQNDLLKKALQNLQIFSSVAQPMQMIMAELLYDDVFIDSFLTHTRMNIHQSYTICTSKLEEMCVPYIQADAGFFVYCDFSSLILILERRSRRKNGFSSSSSSTSCNGVEGEEKFADLVEREARIVMKPGSMTQSSSDPNCMFHSSASSSNIREQQQQNNFLYKPGYFRLCYTWVSPEVLEIGMERLSLLVLRIRRGDVEFD